MIQDNAKIEPYRLTKGRMGSDARYGNNGVFILPGIDAHRLFCIASDQDGWEHVSISLAKKQRLPNWTEMNYVKDIFWMPEECVVQYHPPRSNYVSFAEALHLWRPIGLDIPQPPHWMVAGKGPEETLELLRNMMAPASKRGRP